MKINRRSLIACGLTTTLLLGYSMPGAAFQQDLGVSIALGTKLTCSGVFVVGRDAREYLRNDAYPFIGVDWDSIQIVVDREAQTLELSTPDGRIRKKAVYNASQGCTLIPDGESGVFFTPVEVKKCPSRSDDPALADGRRHRRVRGTSRLTTKPRWKAAVDMAFEEMDASGIPLKTRAFVVLHKGRIVAERYARGFDKDTRHVSWSMGKSITAALVGLLVRDGHVKVDDPAPVGEWRDIGDPRGEITIADLLHMSSGLDFKRLSGPEYFTREQRPPLRLRRSD